MQMVLGSQVWYALQNQFETNIEEIIGIDTWKPKVPWNDDLLSKRK